MENFYNQSVISEYCFDLYLVDDLCTDGTAEAVEKKFQKVIIIPGSGELFWNGGMRLAWSEALKVGYDYYLWLNDDTILYPEALENLMATAKNIPDGIICGATESPDKAQTTYGGRKFNGFWCRPAFTLIEPQPRPVSCDTINGNCVLVPMRVANCVGNLSPDFRHDLGDYDYGLRAKNQGFSSWIAPGYVGTCSGHQLSGSYYDSSLPMPERIHKMKSTSGLPPFKDWLIFTRRHGGLVWPFFWAKALLRAFAPRLWLIIRKKLVR